MRCGRIHASDECHRAGESGGAGLDVRARTKSGPTSVGVRSLGGQPRLTLGEEVAAWVT
jgi:hypothetical protein